MQRISRVTTAMVAVVMLCVGMARAAVLDMVPGEALVVVKVTNLKGASDKIARFCTDLGVAAMVPPLGDPLAFLQEEAKLTNGLNSAGDLAFAFLDPAVTGGDPEKSLVVLVPVSDYAAFLGNEPFAGAKTDGAVTEFSPPNSQETMYAAKWGEYAALSPSKDVVTMQPSGLKVSGVAAKEVAKDIVLFANINNLRGKLQPLLAEGRTEVSGEIERELGRQRPEMAKFAPTIRVAFERIVDVADSFLRDSNASTVAINFVPEGLNISVVAEFNEGSYLGNFVSTSKNTTESFTAGLPQAKYLFYGGFKGDPAHTAKLVEDVASPIVAELAKAGGPEADVVNKLYGEFMTYIKATRSQTVGLLAPQGDVGEVALLQAVNVYKGDAKVMQESYYKLMSGQSELMSAFGMPAEQVPTYKLNKGAKTVDGVVFDQIAGEMKVDPAQPGAAEMEQVMKLLYGPAGMNFYVAALDNDTLIQVFGIDDATISTAIAAAKGNKDELAAWPGVQAVNKQLPASKSGAIYIPIDEIGATALNVAKQFGFPINVQLQPDLPPLGVSFATEGTAIRIDSHASTQLISQLIAAGFQVGMQMNQGPKKGGPGGL